MGACERSQQNITAASASNACKSGGLRLDGVLTEGGCPNVENPRVTPVAPKDCRALLKAE